MTKSPVISSQANRCIQDFIDSLAENEDLNRKTLREYALMLVLYSIVEICSKFFYKNMLKKIVL